jgi:predicted dehydrogenase
MGVSKIRIATIGTWGHLGDPIGELLPLAEVEFVALARAMSEDDESFVRQRVKNSSLPWYDDYRLMLREVRPDVVIVSTRIDRINPIAVDAARAGCHLICEKPLAITHEDLHRLYEAVTAGKVQCIAMLGNGRHPVMQAALKQIESGRAGEVVLINARKSYRWGKREEWFGKRSIYGGSIGWVAIHALEMIADLTGQEFTTVAAMQSNFAHAERPECEDNGQLIFSMSGGVHASVSFDLLRPAAAATHGDDWLRIVGTRGVVEAAIDRGYCRFVSEEQAEMDLPLAARGSYYADYVGAIGRGEDWSAVTRKAFMLTHVALCGRDAADRQAIVSIPRTF